MTAKDAISPLKRHIKLPAAPAATVSSDLPLVDALPLLLEAPARELYVADGRGAYGVIDTSSMLEAIGKFIAPRDDTSIITIECSPADYSASIIARAIEDADAHLVDLWSAPSPRSGAVRVTLRVRIENPRAAVGSLRRYGFEVVDATAHCPVGSAQIEEERLSALQMYLNV